jgi:hypothetical protein
MKATFLTLFLAASPFLVGQEPAGPVVNPISDAIVLPDCGQALAPTNVPKVGANVLYVFDVPKDCLVLVSPPGIATVTKEAGPLKMKGRFIDNANVSTRTYKGKWVYQIDPVPGVSGRVEVLVIPVGATNESQVARKLLDMDGGGPAPSPGPTPVPPGPQPPPNPGPTPPPAPSVPMSGIVFIEETDAAQTARNTFLNDPAFVARRTQKNIKFRTADKDVVGPDGRPPADLVEFLDLSKNKAYPQVFLVGYNNGKRVILKQTDLPKTMTELLNLMSQYGG